jgi:thiamine biosynthesis protein ThiI
MQIIVRIGEIALKKGNRKWFEEKLVRNMKKALGDRFEIKRLYSKFKVECMEKDAPLAIDILSRVFGISSFSLAYEAELDENDIYETVLFALERELKTKNIETFKVKTKRSNKKFPIKSPDFNALVGEKVLEKYDLKVKMKDPDLTINIEIAYKNAYISLNRVKGLGGLPYGTAAKGLMLMSGGIDSPVAAWQMMRRGTPLTFLHFDAPPVTTEKVFDKIKDLVGILKNYSHDSLVLYRISIRDVLREIHKNCDERYFVLLHRRIMMRVANKIAKQERAKFIATGENLGQVASQTVENMAVIEDSSEIPVFRPLISLDKLDIIDLSQKIGSYDISILPFQDSCSLFAPDRPITKARMEDIIYQERNLDMDKILDMAMSNITKVII